MCLHHCFWLIIRLYFRTIVSTMAISALTTGVHRLFGAVIAHGHEPETLRRGRLRTPVHHRALVRLDPQGTEVPTELPMEGARGFDLNPAWCIGEGVLVNDVRVLTEYGVIKLASRIDNQLLTVSKLMFSSLASAE